MALDLLPDTKLAVITGLQASPDLPATVTVVGAVEDNLPALVTATGPYVAVYRPPSPPPLMWARIDRALINVQVWAGTEAGARDTAAIVHAVLHTLPGHAHAGAWIQAVEDVTGLGEMPDPGLPTLFRQVFTARVVAARSLA
jgi:hypothetical protein